MALEIYCWDDYLCFGMIAGAILTSLWVIWRKEGARKKDEKFMYESLLVGKPDINGFENATMTGHLSSSQLWTPCWKGVHPICLLVLRLVAFVVMVGFQVWDVVDWDSSIFVYYTEWTFTLVIIYFGLGTLISAHGCWVYSNNKFSSENGETNDYLINDLEDSRSTATRTFRANDHKAIKLRSHYVRDENQQRASFWGYLMQIIFQTCAGAVILTDIVFWCVIVPFLSIAHFELDLLMGCMHGLNIFFLLLDTSMNSLPFPLFRLSYFVLWSCFYVCFQWIIHACGFSWWPYPFLELSSAWTPLWYFCLALMHIPCYGIFAILMKAKVSVFARWFPRSFVTPY